MVVSAVTVLSCCGASAQWLWIDGSGSKVFSDTAPPPNIPEKNILKRPGARTEASAPVQEPSKPAEAAPDAPKLSGRDEKLEAKKKQAEEAEQAKRKAEAERIAKARADNCERAKRAKATMDSGVRIATTNAKGEREIMDDKARAAEGQRLDGIIQSDCGSSPPVQ